MRATARSSARERQEDAGLIDTDRDRGYTTLGRLADYFEKLRAGDESNAVVQATAPST
jgi:hypothetical protein